jgi:L-alanine-DL-glutamate epimerase-like enolase superfamily enzyme
MTRIEGVEVWLVEGVKYDWTLLRITTEDGLTGVGESTSWPGSPVVEAATRHVGERIRGLDSRRIDFVWTKLYRDLNWIGPAGAALCAISGVDMALLDLNAKRQGVPLYQLLGGAYRTEIELYGNYWFTGGAHTPDDYARQARATVARGFRGLKLDPFAHVDYLYGDDLAPDLGLTAEGERRAVEVVAAVRDAVGPDVLLLVETHAFLNGPTAVRMAARLAPYDIGWFEEPGCAGGDPRADRVDDLGRRAPPHALGHPSGARVGGDRLPHARHHPLRRALGAEADGDDGRGLRRADRSAQPERAPVDAGLGACLREHPELLPPRVHGR